MAKMIVDLGLNQGLGVEVDQQTGEGTFVNIKPGNPRGRRSDSAGHDFGCAEIAAFAESQKLALAQAQDEVTRLCGELAEAKFLLSADALIAERVRAEPDDATVEAAVRAGCTAGDFHLKCTFPDCGCKNWPIATRAAIAAYRQRVIGSPPDCDHPPAQRVSAHPEGGHPGGLPPTERTSVEEWTKSLLETCQAAKADGGVVVVDPDDLLELLTGLTDARRAAVTSSPAPEASDTPVRDYIEHP